LGYTHLWYRTREIPNEIYDAIRTDFDKLILPLHDACVELAGPSGRGAPLINSDMISFNGLSDCGHPRTQRGVVGYPADYAEGVGPSSTAIEHRIEHPDDLAVTVKHRCCNGRCSFETFAFPRIMGADQHDSAGLFCDSVKTAFRPYDIGVTALLLIAKRHLGDRFVVHSNGGDGQWADAKRICQEVLGYGDWFGLIEEQIIPNWRGLRDGEEKSWASLYALIEIRLSDLS
jgi:hypothetical protein